MPKLKNQPDMLRQYILHYFEWLLTIKVQKVPWSMCYRLYFIHVSKSAKRSFKKLMPGNEMNICMPVTSMNMEQEYLTLHEVQLADTRVNLLSMSFTISAFRFEQFLWLKPVLRSNFLLQISSTSWLRSNPHEST